jgi:hypothetical protein
MVGMEWQVDGRRLLVFRTGHHGYRDFWIFTMKCPKCGYPIHPRNNDQNALSHVWYEQIARALGEQTPLQVKAECKLRYGVPILRAEDHEFRAKYDRIIKPLSYEDKIDLMEWFPVTSLMKQGQFARYMNDIQHHYAERGVALESANDPQPST